MLQSSMSIDWLCNGLVYIYQLRIVIKLFHLRESLIYPGQLSNIIFSTPYLEAYAISSMRHLLLGLDQCMQIQNK